MRVEPGVYRHYKGRLYEVLGVGNFGKHLNGDRFVGDARHSETLDQIKLYFRDKKFILEGEETVQDETEHVVYRALYDSKEFGNRALWVRPLEMFLEDIEIDGEEVPRFAFHAREL